MARWHFGLLTVVCLSLLATRASASDFGHYACGGWPGYSPYGVSYSWWYQRERIPYFALHPPVYYSQPVARPYGYSPFAYPPYVLTPEVTSVPAEPVMIPNPYVPQEPAKQEPAKQAKPEASAQAPLTILNPFVAGRLDPRCNAQHGGAALHDCQSFRGSTHRGGKSLGRDPCCSDQVAAFHPRGADHSRNQRNRSGHGRQKRYFSGLLEKFDMGTGGKESA